MVSVALSCDHLFVCRLDDEISAVQDEAQLQWQQAGLQFVSENADDFKNHTDFMPETLPDYPLAGKYFYLSIIYSSMVPPQMKTLTVMFFHFSPPLNFIGREKCKFRDF